MANDNAVTTNGQSERKPLYKKASFYIGIIIIAVIVIAGIKWYQGTLEYVTSDDAFINADRLELSSKVLNRISSLYFSEGDTVKAGQIMAELDSTDFIANLNRAQAFLNNAEAGAELARVNLDKAQMDFNRAEAQLKDNIIPKAEYDNAQKKLEAAKAELKIALSKIPTSKAEIKVIETNLTNTKIYSPINGIVAKKWVLPGDIIQPGMPIYSIYETKDLWVTAMLEETKIASLSLGDSVEIDVDAYPTHIFKGKILKIGTNTAAQFSLIPPSNASGNFTKVTQRIPVKISIINESNQPLKFGLLPGMSVEVKIKVSHNG